MTPAVRLPGGLALSLRQLQALSCLAAWPGVWAAEETLCLALLGTGRQIRALLVGLAARSSGPLVEEMPGGRSWRVTEAGCEAAYQGARALRSRQVAAGCRGRAA